MELDGELHCNSLYNNNRGIRVCIEPLLSKAQARVIRKNSLK